MPRVSSTPERLSLMSALALVASIFLGTQPVSGKEVLFGARGERLSVSQSIVKPGGIVEITGKKFNPEVGIYLALCKIPAVGELPTPCSSVDMTGKSNTGYWISSNAPSYAKGLTKPFKKSGTFKLKLRLNPKIGDFTCSNRDCAITVRADHLRTSDRSYDMSIPIKFKK
jgi:hypothetical protein